MVQLLVMLGALPIVMLGLLGCKPTCSGGSAGLVSGVTYLEQVEPRDAAAAYVVKPKRPKQPKKSNPAQDCKDHGKTKPGKSGRSTMRGANGAKIISRTLDRGTVKQYTYRIDVENPAPGKRPGSLHVQLGGRRSKHYEYGKDGDFVARDGTKLPRTVQNAIDKRSSTQKAIRDGLELLGER